MPNTKDKEKRVIYFQVRLSEPMHAWIVKRAAQNGRTRNNEAVQILKAIMEKDGFSDSS